MRYHVYQFSDKTNNFDLLGPNLPKNGFWGQNFKNLSLDLESASLRYYEHQFSDKTDNFDFLGPNLPKNEFWGQNFKNLSWIWNEHPWDTMCTNIQTKRTALNFWANLPKNGSWSRNFKNLSLDLESTPPLYHVYQFSVKIDNF